MENTTALDAKKVDKYVWLTRQIKENWILSQWAKLKRQTNDTADEEPPIIRSQQHQVPLKRLINAGWETGELFETLFKEGCIPSPHSNLTASPQPQQKRVVSCSREDWENIYILYSENPSFPPYLSTQNTGNQNYSLQVGDWNRFALENLI